MSDTARRAIASRAIGLIDLTDLADDHAPDGIDTLCERAAEHGTAAVCVWPEFVRRCVAELPGSDVRVATVVNFPSGDEPAAEVLGMTEAALNDGADDIDLVLPYRAFLAGDRARAERLISDVAALVGTDGRVFKVILETGELGDEAQIVAAGRLAVDHGAGFLKTSTGKTAIGATPEAVRAMLGVIAEATDGTERSRPIGVKPSGGIRTLDDAVVYLDLADGVMGDGWATPATFRFGASGLLDALLAELTDAPDAPAQPPTAY